MGGIIIFVGVFIVFIIFIKETEGHVFTYRNPYSRKCKACGHTENWYGTGGKSGVWETMYPLQTNTVMCRDESNS